MTIILGFGQDRAAEVSRLLDEGKVPEASKLLGLHQPNDLGERVEHATLAGRAAAALNRHHESRGHLVNALWMARRLPVSRARIRSYLCQILLNSGDLARAQRELRRALEEIRSKPSGADHDLEPKLLAYLASTYRRRGLMGHSVRAYEQAVKMARERGIPQWGYFAINLINALFVLGDFSRATHWLEEMETHPDLLRPDHRLYLGVVAAALSIEINECDRAERALAPVLTQLDRLDPGRKNTALYIHGELLLRLGRSEEALALLEPLARVVEEEPGLAILLPPVVLRLGEALRQLGRHDEALVQFQRSIRLGHSIDPFDVAQGMRYTAKCLLELGRIDDARTTVTEAHAILHGTDYPPERKRLADMARTLGVALNAEPQPVGDGEAARGTEPVWIGLRDGRAFLTVDPRLVLQIRRSADSDLPVLVEGESGTGKELVAHLLHELGPRAKGPFVVVDCTTLSESLAEAELFGVTRGAFTGADTNREGLVAAAEGGTLFLDELTELSLAMQAKLLRLLQEGTYRRVGDPRERRVRTRVVAATNRDVERLVRRGRMRVDLFYRLKGHRLRIPPLRERRGEIRLLADQFARDAGLLGISTDAHRRLSSHSWPGNVRELKMLIGVAAAGVDRGGWVDAVALEVAAPDLTTAAEIPKLRVARGESDRRALLRALIEHQGNVTAAAKSLGISRQAFYKAMRRAGVKTHRSVDQK